VPFPINFPGLLTSYCPSKAVFFHTIYDAWGDRKLELMEGAGLHVELLWRKPEAEKGINASQIRKAIVGHQPWQHLVPASVAQYLIANKIDERIREMNAGK
jgi:citrate lyase synthetase